jgi:L-gulonolactone oxidase
MKTFINWAGNQACDPSQRHTPSSTAAVAAIVTKANDRNERVKAVGAGHSFTGIALTTGHLLSLDRMNRVESVDVERHRITVQAGISLDQLNDALAEHGLAMPNLGDIAYQSVAGAIATATHGTGLRLGNLATTIVGMEMVAGTGEIMWCDEHDNPELLRVARVGLGALGIVTKVTIQCVPAFNLHVKETVELLDDVLDGFADDVEENDHFEFFWIPGTRRAHVKRNNRTDEPAAPPSRLEYFRDKIVAENLAFGTVCRIGRRFPAAVPRVAKLVSSGVSERELIDRSDRVFASPRLVRFYEMEYGIPLEALPEALGRVRALTAELGLPILFPIECRVSAADDIPLSTGFGRASAWIAVHRYQGTDYEPYFRGVEAIMDDYDGRPHWGKLHFQSASTLAPRYPEWAAFASTRAELDPSGTFANDYLDRVLGSP